MSPVLGYATGVLILAVVFFFTVAFVTLLPPWFTLPVAVMALVATWPRKVRR